MRSVAQRKSTFYQGDLNSAQKHYFQYFGQSYFGDQCTLCLVLLTASIKLHGV